MPRTCAFCGDPADSREHLWPDWLRTREDIRESLLHVQAMQVRRGPVEQRQWNDQPFKQVAKVVCEPCNTGWMSVLEQQTKTLMTGMLDGRGKELHRDGLAVLARWAFKTCVVFDRASPPEARVVPPDHGRTFHDSGVPPSGVRIWMAAYDMTQLGVSDVVAAEVTADGQEDPDERNVYVRTFTIGRVAFQVFGTTNPTLFELEYDWPEPNVHLIWPYRGSLTWMPRPAMNDAGMMSFGQRIVDGLIERAVVRDP